MPDSFSFFSFLDFFFFLGVGSSSIKSWVEIGAGEVTSLDSWLSLLLVSSSEFSIIELVKWFLEDFVLSFD